jgi:cytochrome c oxidase subunit II
MNRNVVTIIVSIALVLGVMLIVLANRNTSVAPTQDNEEGATGQNVTPQSSGMVKEITMTATSFEFDPPSITVKQGESVRLKIQSLDVTHGFAIPEFNVNSHLKAGEETVVEFTPDKKGTYTFYCSVFCGHGHQDMKGTLVVE